MTSGPGPDRFSARLAVVAVAVGLLVGCRPAPPAARPEPLGQWYVVQQGETLAEIAKRSGVPEEDLLEVNGFKGAADATPGKMIFVLFGPGKRPEAPPSTEPAPSTGMPAPAADAASGKPANARFRWPVDAPRVTSVFGSRWGRPHEGIDLQAAIGTPVYAADDGEVVYAGNTVRGYGNMVVLKHDDALLTVYAHNSVLLVKVGQRVSGGQRIALSGQSGHATGPHVHFEVRRDQVPRDPLQYLPGKTSKR